jgi:23S rRNA (pseudouridine1915-N3)-methyltransferase
VKISIIAVGRSRGGPERTLQDHYAGRVAAWPLDIREVEEKKKLAGDALKAAEAALIRRAIPDRAVMVALDERGDQIASRDLAARLQRWQDDGVSDVAFLIGGADGLDPALREEAALRLSFGRATWPHQLVRAMLLEQIFRAQSILSGHPYHRD